MTLPEQAVAVLLVDDAAADRLLFKAMLEHSGLQVSVAEAASIAEAEAHLADHGADCVLLDLLLPDAEGLSGLERVAAAAPEAAIVVLSGLTGTDLATQAVATLAQDYLVKGRIEVEALARAVRYAVGRQRVQNTLATTRTALAVSESRFRRAFNDAPMGMALSDVDDSGVRRVAEVNKSLETILGTSRQNLLGTSLADRVEPEDVGAYEVALASLLEHPQRAATVELRMQRTDGATTWVKVTASLIQTPNGSHEQVLVQLEDINERKEAQSSLSSYSFMDSLTRLPNRLLALDRIRLALARAARTGRSVAVLYIDVDHFKVVNDSLGHAAGDDLLRVIGARLPQAIRPEDTAARIGGDEFIVCCDDLPAEIGAAELEAVDIAERVRTHLERPVDVDGADLSVTVSIGIAISGESRRTADELLRDADTALYRAKDKGRSRWEVFDDALRAEAVGRLETERALRTALDKVQLAVHYQPIVELATGVVVGAEALLRWQHPSGGLMTPGDFIRVAEDTGLIVPMGRWVLEQACETLALWRGQNSALTMAVNVSAKQLLRSDLAASVADLCDQFGLKPQNLTLEVTERQLVDLVGSGLSELNSLAEYGVTIALDDFGTGYGSLTYLRTLPVHTVKIDQTFVAGMLTSATDHAIVESVIRLGTALGLDVVAEGVEEQVIADRLVELGCAHAQGWLFGYPVTSEELRSRGG